VAHLSALGAEVHTAVLAEIAPAADPAPVTAALDRLGAGGFAWLGVTSSHAVHALDAAAQPSLTELVRAGREAVPGSTRVAAVGPATARALAAIGIDADLVPTDDRSARGLLAAWPEPPASPGADVATSSLDTEPARDVLLAQGDLAEPTLAAGLEERGWRPSTVVVYRNLPAAPLDPTLRASLAAGKFDAVLLTSGSVAERLRAQVSPPPETVYVALGPRTAATLAELGVTVAATSQGPDAESVARAVVAAVVGAEPLPAGSLADESLPPSDTAHSATAHPPAPHQSATHTTPQSAPSTPAPTAPTHLEPA